MPTAFLGGLFVGYPVAIAVGPISILIMETGLRRGFRVAAAAGLGAATADGVYALAAALAGAAIAPAIEPFAGPIRLVSAVTIALIGVRRLLQLKAEQGALTISEEAAQPSGSAARTFGLVLGLTIVNPMTITYFAALILGLQNLGTAVADRVAFGLGVFLASLSWQSVIAGFGAILHRRLSPGARLGVSLAGNALILVLAVLIARSAIAS